MNPPRSSMIRRLSSADTHRILECTAVSATAVVATALFASLWSALAGPADLFWFSAAWVTSYFAADLFSGFVHWSFDRFFDEHTPLLGEHFVRPFREHHEDPLEITRHDFIELNGNTSLPAAPVLAATLMWFDPTHAGSATIFGTAFVLFFAVWTVLTNTFHEWAHRPEPPAFVRGLQRCHLVLPPAHHVVHHRSPHDVRYCITSGWMNGWADRFGLFNGLERLLRKR